MIQAYYDNKLVGNYTGFDGRSNLDYLSIVKTNGLSSLKFVDEDEHIDPAEFTDQRIDIPINMRAARFSRIELEINRDAKIEFMRRYKIPDYADQIEIPHHSSIEFRWPALELDVVQYEMLFGMDEFQPV